MIINGAHGPVAGMGADANHDGFPGGLREEVPEREIHGDGVFADEVFKKRHLFVLPVVEIVQCQRPWMILGFPGVTTINARTGAREVWKKIRASCEYFQKWRHHIGLAPEILHSTFSLGP